jgi:hypothetical protein
VEGESPAPFKTLFYLFTWNITLTPRTVCEIRATDVGIVRQSYRGAGRRTHSVALSAFSFLLASGAPRSRDNPLTLGIGAAAPVAR